MIRAALVGAALFAFATQARAEEFTYAPPGELTEGSGEGRADATIYAPGLRFPMEVGPAYANSQVWGNGGGEGEGNQCDAVNFSYPWRDNYCESRRWEMPLCPSGTGHQGQDIRAADCTKDEHWVVAVTDGTITQIGGYTVYLTDADGTRYDYLHMSNVQVERGDEVVRGQRLGKVSNQFGGTPTTVHLHFNILQTLDGVGSVFVPPYTSLVAAYQELLDPSPKDAGVDSGASSSSSSGGPEEVDAGGSSGAPNEAPVLDEELEEGCACDAHAGVPLGHGMLLAIVGLVLRRKRNPRS